ncbi:hypothetical protein DFS34DRAFT_186357 [Phlyctochytrium arcticum]|nr:hypothetical protein DFS34DRAFT_186357 [Phlyctochytrium arcticum]
MGASESKATSTYSLKETVWEEGNAAGSPFNLYRAVHKTTGQPASVFTYQKAKGSQQSPEDVAELGKAVQRLRTIRHPGIGKFLAADVGDNGLFLAIEPVSPLALTINDLSPEEVCVGIYNILKTVAFLHSQELAHNNIQMDSVFVADGDGRWVLGGMEHVCSFEESSTVKLGKIHLHLPEEYTPPEDQSENSAGIQPDARDAYGLGVLIRALIGPYLKREKPAGSFDWKLLDICAKNLSETAADDRPRIEDVLATEFFENNVFLDVVEKFLKEVRVIDAEVKKERFGELPTDLQELSTQNIVKYVLPLVLNRDMMSEPGADAFYAQLLIPSRENEHGPGVLPVKEYDEHILPFIEEMWRVRSYNVRIVLLQLFHRLVVQNDVLRSTYQLDDRSYITELLNWDGSLLQGMIIPEIILGLDDVDDPLYTLSLCALAPLIEKLCMQTQHSKNIAESQDGFGITLAPSGSNDRRSMGMSGRQLSKEPRREGSAEFKPLPSVVTPPARTVHKLGPWGPGDPPSPMEAPLPSPLSRRLTGGSINNEGSNNLPRARRQSSSNGALDSTTAGNASNKANTANAPSGIPESRYTPQILVENLIIPHTLNVSVMDHMPMEQKWLVIDALIHMWKRLCFIEATNKVSLDLLLGVFSQ